MIEAWLFEVFQLSTETRRASLPHETRGTRGSEDFGPARATWGLHASIGPDSRKQTTSLALKPQESSQAQEPRPYTVTPGYASMVPAMQHANVRPFRIWRAAVFSLYTLWSCVPVFIVFFTCFQIVSRRQSACTNCVNLATSAKSSKNKTPFSGSTTHSSRNRYTAPSLNSQGSLGRVTCDQKKKTAPFRLLLRRNATRKSAPLLCLIGK